MLDQAARRRTLVAVVVVGVGLDQLTKYLATLLLVRGQVHSYLGGVLEVLYTLNTGAFLSIGEHLSQSARVWIFIVGVSVVVIAAATYVWRSRLARADAIIYSLIAAGGLGNLIDRALFHSQVRDFLNMGIGSVRTGVFNVADMMITAAVLAFLVRAARQGAASA